MLFIHKLSSNIIPHVHDTSSSVWWGHMENPRPTENSLLKTTQPLYHRGKTRSEKKEEEEEEEDGEEEEEEEEPSTLKFTFFSTNVYTGFTQPLSMVHKLAFGSHYTFMELHIGPCTIST